MAGLEYETGATRRGFEPLMGMERLPGDMKTAAAAGLRFDTKGEEGIALCERKERVFPYKVGFEWPRGARLRRRAGRALCRQFRNFRAAANPGPISRC